LRPPIPGAGYRARKEGRVMTETWDWILIYSILFLLGGLLARTENKSGAHAQDRAHRPR
jgi:hypothetical protein